MSIQAHTLPSFIHVKCFFKGPCRICYELVTGDELLYLPRHIRRYLLPSLPSTLSKKPHVTTVQG